MMRWAVLPMARALIGAAPAIGQEKRGWLIADIADPKNAEPA